MEAEFGGTVISEPTKALYSYSNLLQPDFLQVA